MKTLKTLALLFAFLFATSFVYSQGKVTRNISPFNKLQIGGAFDVYLQKGDKESVRIETENVNPEKVITENDGNTLKVYQEKGNYNMKGKVYITFKNLEKIDRGGSGNLVVESDLEASDFTFNTSGSGDVNVKGKIKAADLEFNSSGSGNSKISSIEADELDLNLSGSGNIDVSSGKTGKQELNIAGSGNISAFGMKSEESEVAISGSGNVEVYADKSLEGSIAGSGNIHYKGDAQVTKSAIKGSGEISKN